MNKEDKLYKKALQGIRATGKVMRRFGQAESYKRTILEQVGKAIAKQKSANPSLTVAECMADYDSHPEDAKIYSEIGISREEFQAKVEEALASAK